MSADPPAEPAAPMAPRPPWQPLTPRGLARFAQATLGRLFLVALIVAIVVALAVVWFLRTVYAPVVTQAVQKMPDGARIQNGQLVGVAETLLSETKLIAIAVTPDESTDIGQSADAQIQLRQHNFRIGSVFRPDWGMEFDYGPQNIDLGRAALEPLWGAWRPVVFTGCGVAVVAALGVSWTLLALLYTAPTKLASWFADRQLSWFGAWKISAAAQMIGALLLVLALVLYGLEAIDLIGVACFLAGHFVLDWIYLGAALHCLERSIPPPPKNPFLKSA